MAQRLQSEHLKRKDLWQRNKLTGDLVNQVFNFFSDRMRSMLIKYDF